MAMSQFEMRTLRPLVPFRVFLWRFVRGAVISAGMVGVGLAIGTGGYHVFEGVSWLDAMLNASMLLAGEGPIAPLRTTGGKLFATFYAIFSGVVFITAISTMIAPVAHRILHRFHLELTPDDDEDVQAGGRQSGRRAIT